MTLDFTAGQTRSCETRNLSSRADPVLHLLAPKTGNGVVNEVARDDDSAGNLNARFRYRASTAGKYRLVMRASWNGGGGTADLLCDGRVVWLGLPVGGAFKRLERLRNGETLTTVPLPRGPRVHTLYTLDDDGRLLDRYESGANESAGRPVSNANVQIVMVAGTFPDETRPVRLVRNDRGISGHDPDGDGLGSELEAQIGTCSNTRSVVGNWDCSRSSDARDTDGDGIQDGTELLGALLGAPYQLLPRWGSDPRHKDVFIEVDFMARSRTDVPRTLSGATAVQMAGIYADMETEPLLRLSHAQALENPDLQPGIRLHLDTGEDPPASADEKEFATYGDWGGHDVAAPVCDDDGNCQGADAADVWSRMMHRNRVGIFHYALGYPGSGGQAPLHSAALNLPLDDANTAAHEFGHTLGIDHSGPEHDGAEANCKPNYPSLMSYAYLGRPNNTFSDGFGRPVLNNVSLIERAAVPSPTSGPGKRYLSDLSEVFGYNVDKGTGSVDWDRDGVFADGVVRAYANNDHSSCEFTRSNQMRTGGRTDGVPALARLDDKTIVFYADERDRRLWLDYTTDDLTCPSPTEGHCGPPLKRREVSESWNRRILSIAAHRIAVGGEKKILLVFRTDDGLFETTMNGGFRWTAPAPIRLSSPAADEFSLTGDESHAILAFKDGQGNVFVKVRDATPNSWSGDEIVRDAAGNQIKTPGFLSCPSVLEVTENTGRKVLLGVFPQGDQGLLRLYSQDPSNGRWVKSPWQMSNEASIGRPTMTWEPVGPGSPMPGRLRIFYLHRQTTGDERMVRQRTLQAIGLGPQAVLSLKDEDHDNVWYFGNGVDALFEPGVDSNVRLAVATALLKEGLSQPHYLDLRPKADGVVDLVQRNWNDWEGLGVDTCRTLKSVGAQVNCKPWPF